jgi:hypothetical protein
VFVAKGRDALTVAGFAQYLRAHKADPNKIFRSARQLLSTGHYKLNSTVATGITPPRHNGRSQLREAPPIARLRSK